MLYLNEDFKEMVDIIIGLHWQPETDAMKDMRLREIELQHLPGANERWENYMQYLQYTQSRMVPRFTEKDFAII